MCGNMSGTNARALDRRWVLKLDRRWSCVCLNRFSVADCWLVPHEPKPWRVKRLKWPEDCTAVTWVQMLASELTLTMTVRYRLMPVHVIFISTIFEPWYPHCVHLSLILRRGHNQRKQREPVDGSVSQQPGARWQDCGKIVRLTMTLKLIWCFVSRSRSDVIWPKTISCFTS